MIKYRYKTYLLRNKADRLKLMAFIDLHKNVNFVATTCASLFYIEFAQQQKEGKND